MPKKTGGHSKRSDLFVVRIWCDGPADTSDRVQDHDEDEGEGKDEEGTTTASACRGRVHRAINGEAHDFQGWPALIQVLEGMLSAVRPARKPATPLDGKDSDNNPSG